MIGLIIIEHRGATPGIMKREMNQIQKETWFDTGTYYHANLRDKRFTKEHAREANYTRRKGELLGRGTKRFNRSYTGRKLRTFGHTRPLEYSGKARRLVKSARISSTGKGVRVAYPGARVFNFRHPKSRVNAAEEFTRVLPRETDELSTSHDRGLDRRLNSITTTETTTIKP